jgi:hypothetical protein
MRIPVTFGFLPPREAPPVALGAFVAPDVPSTAGFAFA